ncbi:MAG TPA: hypothetical protein VGP33_17215 [Chloroflexota bacterium]|jgi:hypothetical protein|nr:hypothetical protein [Chloroflexota bacterium]
MTAWYLYHFSIQLWVLIIPLFLLGGLGRRVAGGVLGQWFNYDSGALISRGFYGLTVALAALLGGAIWWHSLLVIPAIYVGCTWPNNMTFPAWTGIAPVGGIGLGRQAGGSFWRDAAGLEVHGVIGTALVALGAFFAGYVAWWLMVIAGLLIVPLYLAGWQITGRPVNLRYPLGMQVGSEWGEALWGGAVAALAFTTAMVG